MIISAFPRHFKSPVRTRLLGELGVGAAQVGLQVTGRLVGHLDAPSVKGDGDEKWWVVMAIYISVITDK